MVVYGDLGAIPLDVDIKSRMLTFWARLCSGEKHKITNTIYSLLYTLDEKKYLSLNGWKLLRQQLPIIALFYRSIQTVSEDKIKRSVYSKVARNYITRRKMYSLSYY